MPEPMSVERDRSVLLQCRARVADTHAHVALLDGVVSRADSPGAHAPGIRGARTHLEAALADLDAATAALGQPAALSTSYSTEVGPASPPAS